MRRCLLAFALCAVATSSFAAIKTRPVEWKVGTDTFSGHLVYDDAVKKKALFALIVDMEVMSSPT